MIQVYQAKYPAPLGWEGICRENEARPAKRVRRWTSASSALLSQAADNQERQRREYAKALAAKDRDLRQAEERHAGQERRMLAEVDQARQATKRFEAGLNKEQQRRIQSEEAAAQTLEAGRRILRETQQAAQELERELRDQLTQHSGLLAQAQSQGSALELRLVGMERQLGDEKKSHEETRGLLAGALVAVRQTVEQPRKPSVRRSKPASP